jgi:hypothetical protein
MLAGDEEWLNPHVETDLAVFMGGPDKPGHDGKKRR